MVRRRTTASPEAVWAVLADGWRYADWVVGAHRIRAVQGAWPRAGSRIHHTVGRWPAEVDDETEVLSCDPGHRLVLQARVRPLFEARIEISLEPLPDGGCEMSLVEHVTGGPSRLLLPAVRHALLDARNVEVLRQLARLAEQPRPAPFG